MKTHSLIASMFFILLWLMNSKCSKIVNTELLISSSQNFTSNSGPMTCRPCVEIVGP